MSDMIRVPAEKIAALREAVKSWPVGEPDADYAHANNVRAAARAVVDAVETEDETQGMIRHPADENGPYEAHYDHVVCGRCTPAPSPARDDAEKAIAGLLARHTREDVGSYISCLCGWRHVGPYPTGARPYIAHLASVIAAHMAAPDELTALRQRVAELESDIQGVAGGALVEEAEQSTRRIYAQVERDMARQALTSADAMNRHWDEINAHRDLLVAERDALRERIRALADEWEADSQSFSVLEWADAIEQVRALLGGDA